MEKESLESQALRQFDALIKRGEAFWEPNKPRLVKAGLFKFQFRVAPSFQKKPIQRANDPGRTRDLGVFSDSDPDFFIRFIGPSHKLILNKYCVVRPQFVLHTTEFTPQSDHLTGPDFAAAWSGLTGLERDRNKYVVIYNCGVEAGSSLGHKHMQILPRPMGGEDGFSLFPDQLEIEDGRNTLNGLPYKHAIKKLSCTPTTEELVDVYGAVKAASGIDQGTPHNVILVNKWMMVAPRSHAKQGTLAANAAGMAGMVWVNREENVKEWVERGPLELLHGFGVAEN